MSETTLFRFEGKPLNVEMDENGDAIFDASEVCRILGLAHAGSALRVLDADEKGVQIKHTPGGEQSVSFITEPGLYKLIGRSRKPEAKRFDRWVRHEVLPTIRKTGGYSVQPPMDDMTLLSKAVLLASKRIEVLETENAIMAPKAIALDRIALTNGLTNLREVGKVLGIGPKRGIELMREDKLIFRSPTNGRWNGYSTKIDAGLIDVKFVTYRNSAGEEVSTQQVFVTPKGMTRLALRLGQN